MAGAGRLAGGAVFRAVGLRRGRARMVNAGAARAGGTWIWFLHAVTRYLSGSLEALTRFLGRDLSALGWFDLPFRPDGPALTRLNALGGEAARPLARRPIRRPGVRAASGWLPRAGRFRRAHVLQRGPPFSEDHLFVWTARRAGIPARSPAPSRPAPANTPGSARHGQRCCTGASRLNRPGLPGAGSVACPGPESVRKHTIAVGRCHRSDRASYTPEANTYSRRQRG